MSKQVIQPRSGSAVYVTALARVKQFNEQDVLNMTMEEQKEFALANPGTARNVLTKVWLDRAGNVHAIDNMDMGYKRNVLLHWLSSELKHTADLSMLGRWILCPEDAWTSSESYNDFAAIRAIWASMPLTAQDTCMVMFQQKALDCLSQNADRAEAEILDALDLG